MPASIFHLICFSTKKINNMQLKYTAVVSLLTVLCFLSCKRDDTYFPEGGGSKSEVVFIRTTSNMNYAEMSSGEITLDSRGNDPQVKAFGGLMVLEHMNSQKDLR